MADQPSPNSSFVEFVVVNHVEQTQPSVLSNLRHSNVRDSLKYPALRSLLILVRILARVLEAVLEVSCMILQAVRIKLTVRSRRFSKLLSQVGSV